MKVGRKRKSQKKHDFNGINRVMNYTENYSKEKLVCITNGKEVIRITRENAKEYFYSKITADKDTLKAKKKLGYEVNFDLNYYYERNPEWFYTTKKVYKQYQKSLKPGSKTPTPLFHKTITVLNHAGEKTEQVIKTNVFLNY